MTAGYEGGDMYAVPPQVQAEIDRHEMARANFFNQLNALIFEELELDTVELLRKLMHDVAEHPDPRAQANYLEGLLTGATESRRRLRGPDLTELGYMASHGFVDRGDQLCGFPGCGLPSQAKSHQP